jgi:hypothetical protein
MPKGRVRKLAEGLAKSAAELRSVAYNDPQVCVAYNALCDVLDNLNYKLAFENDGPLKVTWKRIH